MRRLLFVLFLLFASLFFYEDLIGFAMKAVVRVFAKARLAYRDLHIEDGQLVLEDVILFDVSGGKSSYFLRSDTALFDWKNFSIHLQGAHFTLCSDLFKPKQIVSGKGGRSFDVQIEDGRIEWSDAVFPAADFSYLGNEINIHWEQGDLKAYKTVSGWRVEATDLPLKFLARHVPISNCSGEISGTLDVETSEENGFSLCLKAEGKDLCGRWHDLSWGGGFSLDWEARDLRTLDLLKTHRLRLSIEGGSVASSTSEIQNIELLGTFQAGLGTQWDVKGLAKTGSLSFPASAAGKAFVSSSESMWAEGSGRFGNAEWNLRFDDEVWKFAWKGLQSLEGQVLQGFVAVFDERVIACQWISGSVQGAFEFGGKRGVRWERFDGTDLYSRIGQMEIGCSQAVLEHSKWKIHDVQLSMGTTVECRGNASYGSSGQSMVFQGVFNGDPTQVSFFFNPSFEQASILGALGDLHFNGSIALQHPADFELSISHFEGNIPNWISNFIEGGRVGSIEPGFQACWNMSQLKNWSLACKVEQAKIAHEQFKVLNIQGELYANNEGIDCIASRGLLSLPIGSKIVDAKVASPRISYNYKGDVRFDIRLEDEQWDLVRVVGTKEKGGIQIDRERSHLFGESFTLEECTFANGSFSTAKFDASIPWHFLKAFLEERQFDVSMAKFNGNLQLKGFFERSANGWQAILDSSSEYQTTPVACRFEGNETSLRLPSLRFGPVNGSCHLIQDGGSWRVTEGHALWEERGIFFDFSGKTSEGSHLNLSLNSLKADLSKASNVPMKGFLEGHGCIAIDQQKIESDLDLIAKDVFLGAFHIENKGSLHLYATTEQKAYLTGLDCRVFEGNQEMHGSADLVCVDFNSEEIAVQKGRVHAPSDLIDAIRWHIDSGSEIDLYGDCKVSFDGSKMNGHLQEAFLPLLGETRHMTDMDISLNSGSLRFNTVVSYRGKQAAISGFVEEGAPLRGNLSLQEVGSSQRLPLRFDWSYAEGEGISIDSIEGAFAGLDASFRSISDLDSSILVGSSAINFRTLSDWIPPGVAKGFHELEMGGGYELKGTLRVPKKEPMQSSFQGLFCGKEIDLFGFVFKTLMAQADVSLRAVRIHDVKVSDSAGLLKIDEILLGSDHKAPWTIDIPKVQIQDLRPSFFRRPGKEQRPITPLLVRKLTMTNFHGLLDDGATYKATGNLSFVNSFKREKTVLDLPSDLFGRIIGLDLELLIPVEGDITFELKDGYFHLTDLKNAYSEGGRSEFFLVQSGTSPRIDLKGNLQILVTMKQFVLFALTEAFMISIDGKLSDPEFGLQKKRRFL